MADATARDLGEHRLVAEVCARLSAGPGVLVGPGDDAAVVAHPDGRVVATTDVLVEGVHFRRDWSPAYDVGRKAAAANLADVAAMGAGATALLVGLVAPADLPLRWALDLTDGLRDEAALVGASVVGGDVVGGPVLVVAVTALGDLGGRPPVTRAGARPGDVVALAGRLGYAAAGLAMLLAGRAGPGASSQTCLEGHRRPSPPYRTGVALAEVGATAMCDVSDGLLADLGHVARASDVGMVLERAAIEVGPELVEVGSLLGVDPWDWVLTGGEDHALVATLPEGAALPAGCRAIGRVVAGAGVQVSGGVGPLRPPGWEHFR